MFTLGIQQKALQCLTSRSMLWTGNSALPSVWRVYLHRPELPWWYWGEAFAQERPGGCWLSKRTFLCSESWQGLWELSCPSLLLSENWEPPSAWPEDTGWTQLWHWAVGWTGKREAALRQLWPHAGACTPSSQNYKEHAEVSKCSFCYNRSCTPFGAENL